MGSREIRNAEGIPHRARAIPRLLMRPRAFAPSATPFALTSTAAASSSSPPTSPSANRRRSRRSRFLQRTRWASRTSQRRSCRSFHSISTSPKLHAYTGSYGQDARESTRVKDLVDLVLIGELAELDAERLGRALATTFEGRARHPLPAAVPPPPSSWARPYAELAREVGIAVEIEAGHAAATRLLDPVLRSEAGGRWDPETGRWRQRA